MSGQSVRATPGRGRTLLLPAHVHAADLRPPRSGVSRVFRGTHHPSRVDLHRVGGHPAV